MKNKIILCIAIFALTTFFSGCASNKKPILNNYSPMAVVSVYGNSGVPWYEDPKHSGQEKVDNTHGGMLTGAINRTLNKGDVEVETVNERIDSAMDAIFYQLSLRGIQTIPQDVVSNSDEFKKSGNSFLLKVDDRVSASSSKVISSRSSKKRKALAEQTGAKSLLFTEFTFYKEKVATSLTKKAVAARVELAVSAYDNEGRAILSKKYAVRSDQTVEYENGRYSRTELCELFPSTVDKILEVFLNDFDFTQTENNLNSEDYSNATRIRIPQQNAPDSTEESSESETYAEAEK